MYNTSISFHELINALDGVMANDGRIIIFTTNHIEKLDKELL